jgi:hypothetical protein
MDFVFVDDCHDYINVVSDSRVARRLLRPEGGTIVWHYCSVHGCDEVSQRVPGDGIRAHPADQGHDAGHRQVLSLTWRSAGP